MRVLIKPQPLSGTLTAPPSKADAHRKLICASLADKPTLLSPISSSEDIGATVSCLRELGADIKVGADGFTVHPIQSINPNPRLDCRESGSTLRFLLPLTAMLTQEAAFSGCGRLPARPVEDLLKNLRQHGANISSPHLPFTAGGGLRGGLYSLPGHVSSQYISGLLLALPLAKEDSQITLTTPLQARGYVDMTVNTLQQFGVTVTADNGGFSIPGQQSYYSPDQLAVEGDWSNAAFFLAAGALGGPVCLRGLNQDSPQGDKRILEILRNFGARVELTKDSITVQRGELRGQDIDIADTPDLAPVLAVLGALAEGRTRLLNAARLRLKESDRLVELAALLSRLGARVVEGPDYLTIEGQPQLCGGTVRCQGDHRIVMAASLAASCCNEEIVIIGAEAVRKSYPRFFSDYNSLGGMAYDVYLG